MPTPLISVRILSLLTSVFISMHLKLSSRGKIVVYDHDPLTGLGLGEGPALSSPAQLGADICC